MTKQSWTLAPHLALLNEYLIELSARRITRLIVSMPPRHGKSEFVSKYFPAWYLGVFPSHRIILTSYESSYAMSWGRKTKELFEQVTGPLWGYSIAEDMRSRNAWEIAQYRGGMQTAGAGGPLTGKGANCLIVDDPFKNSEEAMSSRIRDNIWEWWRGTARTRLEPGGISIIVMTRWHQLDIAGRLLAEAEQGGEKWVELRLPALAEDDDALGRASGEALWPERYNVADLEALKTSVGSFWWAAEYQQRPSPAGGGIFKQDWFRRYSLGNQVFDPKIGSEPAYFLHALDGTSRPVRIADCLRFSTMDPAVSTKQTADYTVLSTWAMTPDRDLILLDVRRDRFTGPDQPALVRSVYDAYRPAAIDVEAIAYQLSLVQTLVRSGLPVREIRPDKDKVSRALTVAARYEAGTVYHPMTAPWLADFEDELLSFPNGAHDDQVDTASMAGLRVAMPVEPRIRTINWDD